MVIHISMGHTSKEPKDHKKYCGKNGQRLEYFCIKEISLWKKKSYRQQLR